MSTSARVARWSLLAVLAAGCAAGTEAVTDTSEPTSPKDAGASDGSSSTVVPPAPDAGDDEEDAGASTDASTTSDATTAKDAAADASTKDASTTKDAAADAAAPFDAGPLDPLEGDVVISEVMFNPSGTEPDAEWIEVANTTAMDKSLSGLVLEDGASPVNTHTIGANVIVPAGGYVVLVASKAAAATAQIPAAAIVYEYGTNSILLGNSKSGSIALLRGATEIARAHYGALGLGGAANGQSVQLSVLTYAGAGLAASWCKSANTWVVGGTDKGTPGAASDCP